MWDSPELERRKVLEVKMLLISVSHVGFVILLPSLAQEKFCKQKGEGGKKNTLGRARLFSSSTSGHLLLTLGFA